MNRIRAILATAAVGLAAGLSLAAPAHATTTEPTPVCGTWSAKLFVGAAPGVSSPLSVSHTATTATLKRVAPVNGVEYLRKSLDFTGPLTITVQVDATAEEAASGAVRIFGYESTDPNTMTDAPTYGAPHDASAVATGPGALTLTLDGGEKLGALGFTWDSSNPATGEVTFGPGSIDGRPINFNACPEPEQSPSPSASPSPGGTKPPTAKPSATPVGAAPTLPKTGAKAAVVGGIAGALLLVGAGAFFLARERRRNRFVA